MNQITKITLTWDLYEQQIPKIHIAQKLGIHRETVGLWIKGIENNPKGLIGFIDNYLAAKKGERIKRKLDRFIKKQILKIRDENRDCCGQKIREYLYQESGVLLSTKTIYQVLREKYQLRSKWKKNQARGPQPQAIKPRPSKQER